MAADIKYDPTKEPENAKSNVRKHKISKITNESSFPQNRMDDIDSQDLSKNRELV